MVNRKTVEELRVEKQAMALTLSNLGMCLEDYQTPRQAKEIWMTDMAMMRGDSEAEDIWEREYESWVECLDKDPDYWGPQAEDLLSSQRGI